MTAKRTSELQSGDMVTLPGGVIRTVKYVTPSQWVSNARQPLLFVYYVEGETREWGPGNSAHADDTWSVIAAQPSLFEHVGAGTSLSDSQ